jgi:hypothetical protein
VPGTSGAVMEGAESLFKECGLGKDASSFCKIEGSAFFFFSNPFDGFFKLS